MTQEEKAKAYDEALTIAKRIISKNCSEVEKLCLKSIFPELAESEDERIRKELIELVNELISEPGRSGITVGKAEKYLAYLEKQKDLDKMIVVSPEVWDKAIADAYENGKKDGEKQKEWSWRPTEEEMGVLYKLCYLSNQITDEDDTELTRLYQDLKREYFNGHSFENMFPKEKQKESLRDFIDNFPYSDEQKEQKPIFRVGDTLKRKGKEYTFTVHTIRGGFYLTENGSFFPIEEQDNWERIEQKPAEWSEEDEEMINTLVSYVEDPSCWNLKCPREKLITFIKSLRPSWKPSDK